MQQDRAAVELPRTYRNPILSRALSTVGIARGGAYVMAARSELQAILAAQQGRPGDAPPMTDLLARQLSRR
jgi:hypothetical protein